MLCRLLTSATVGPFPGRQPFLNVLKTPLQSTGLCHEMVFRGHQCEGGIDEERKERTADTKWVEVSEVVKTSCGAQGSLAVRNHTHCVLVMP